MCSCSAPRPSSLLAQPTAAQAALPAHPSCFSAAQPVLRPARRPKLSDHMADAVTRGDVSLMQHLLAEGQDINAANSQDETALHLAAEHGHADVVAVLLEKGADVSATCRTSGKSVLEIAVRGTSPGCAEVVQQLVVAGADISCYDIFSNDSANPLGLRETVLHIAVQLDSVDKVEALLAAGVQPTVCNGRGVTPLFAAVRSTAPNAAAILQALIKAVPVENNNDTATQQDLAAVNGTQTAGTASSAQASMHHSSPSAVKAGPSSLAVQHPCHVLNGQDKAGDTLLHLAIKTGKTECVRALVEAGAALDILNHAGAPALHLATVAAFTSAPGTTMLQILLDAAADVNMTDTAGKTALHWATEKVRQHDHVKELVRLLLKAGADPAASTTGNKVTALQYASSGGHCGAVQLLLDEGADAYAASSRCNPPLFCALLGCCNQDDRIAVMRLLLNAGVLPCSTDKAGDPILYTAASRRDVAAVKLLLSSGADACQQNTSGATALHAVLRPVDDDPDSCELRNVFFKLSGCDDHVWDIRINNIVEQLLAQSDVEAQLQPSGDRPLHLAVGTNNATAVQQLLAAGADPTAVRLSPADGLHRWLQCTTVMDLAAMCGSVEVVQLVLDAYRAAGQPCPVTLQVLQKAVLQSSASGVCVLCYLLSYWDKQQQLQQQQQQSQQQQPLQLTIMDKLRQLLSYWHKKQPQQSQQQRLTITDAYELRKDISSLPNRMIGGQYMAALLCYLYRRDARAETGLRAGQLQFNAGAHLLQDVLRSAESAVRIANACLPRSVAEALGGLDYTNLGLGMLKLWSADKAAANQQHKAFLAQERELGGLRARLSSLALLMGASKKALRL